MRRRVDTLLWRTMAGLLFVLFLSFWPPWTSHALSPPLTVVATMKMMPDAPVPESDFRLAGFYSQDQSSEPILAVVWRQRREGWFPTWEIGLEIDPSLVWPGHEVPGFVRTGTAITGPEGDHVYETTLSYDPASGVVSASVVNLTVGSQIFAIGTRLQTYSEALQPRGGEEYPESAVSHFVFSPPQVVEAFVPVGAQWRLLASDGKTLLDRGQSLLSIDRRRHGKITSQLIHPQYKADGHFRLIVDDGHTSQEVTRHSPAANGMEAIIHTVALPVGRSRLALQYVHEDRVWDLDSRPLRVGVLEMAMAPVEISGDQWTGKLTLAGDGAFPDLGLKLDLTVNPLFDYPSLREKQTLKATILDTEVRLDGEKPVTLSVSLPHPVSDHRKWTLVFEPTLSKDVVLDFTGKEDVLLLTGRGRYVAPEIDVEIEEEVYRFVPADNGAGPMWCRGSTSLVRCGELVFVAGLETLPDAKPLNNCVPLLFYRDDEGWKQAYRGDEDNDRTREPSPVVCFDDGRLFLSVNPTLTPRDTYNGPSEPRLLEFDTCAPESGYRTHLPVWDGTPRFTEHSYRSFAADAANHELILFQNIGYTHAEWAFLDRDGEWSARGQLIWPWAKEYDEPGPVRICYPTVALKDRKVYFFGVSDVVEPYGIWRERKKEITGRDWDYDFRRLFFTWSDDIRSGQFHRWVEISTRDSTAGWLTPCDLSVDEDGNVRLLWIERALDERLRDEFFPLERQSYTLNYAVVRDGTVLLRRVVHFADEDNLDEVPTEARFHLTSSGRLFIFYLVRHANGLENRIMEVFADGTTSPPQKVPLRQPMIGFTATPRAGSKPTEYLDLLGAVGTTVRYARLRINDTDQQ